MPAFKSVIRASASVGVVIAVLLFAVTSLYLFNFMAATNRSVQEMTARDERLKQTDRQVNMALLARFAMARVAFNSCGLAVGLAIAFLSVALFLFGILDSMGVQAEHGNSKINISQMSAGGFALLCSTLIVVVCMTSKPTLEFSEDEKVGRVNTRGDRFAPPSTNP